MCDSQEAAKQNGLCCLETLQECQNKNLSLYAASSYDGTSRKALFMEEQTKLNTCICSPDHLRISRMIKQLFSKSSSFFQSRRLAISPLKFKESSWRSLSHTKRSLTQGIWLPELLSHIEHQAGNKFNTHDYIFLPASPSSTTPFRVGGSATVDMGTGRTTLMIT